MTGATAEVVIVGGGPAGMMAGLLFAGGMFALGAPAVGIALDLIIVAVAVSGILPWAKPADRALTSCVSGTLPHYEIRRPRPHEFDETGQVVAAAFADSGTTVANLVVQLRKL